MHLGFGSPLPERRRARIYCRRTDPSWLPSYSPATFTSASSMEAPHRSGEKRRQDDHDRGYGRDDDRNRQRHHRLSTASSSTSSSSRHTGGYRGEGRDYDERRAERDDRDEPRRELLGKHGERSRGLMVLESLTL